VPGVRNDNTQSQFASGAPLGSVKLKDPHHPHARLDLNAAQLPGEPLWTWFPLFSK